MIKQQLKVEEVVQQLGIDMNKFLTWQQKMQQRGDEKARLK